MSREQILAGVRKLLATHLAVDRPVYESTDLGEELRLDSLAQLTLVVEIENHFRICFEPGAEERIDTVGDVVTVVARALADAGEGARV